MTSNTGESPTRPKESTGETQLGGQNDDISEYEVIGEVSGVPRQTYIAPPKDPPSKNMSFKDTGCSNISTA